MDSTRQDYQMDLNSRNFFQKVSTRQEEVFTPLYHSWNIFQSFSEHGVADSESKCPSWASAAPKNVRYLWEEYHVPTFQAVKQARKLSQFHVTVPDAEEV